MFYNDKRLQIFLMSLAFVSLGHCSTELDNPFAFRDATLENQRVRLSNILDGALLNVGKYGAR